MYTDSNPVLARVPGDLTKVRCCVFSAEGISGSPINNIDELFRLQINRFDGLRRNQSGSTDDRSDPAPQRAACAVI
jgi:hypothetical protein